MNRLDVTLLPLLTDNYAYLLRDRATGRTAVVDPSEGEPVIRELERRGLELDFVLNTHHHWDHVGGDQTLKERYGCPVVGPAYDRHRLSVLDQGLTEGDTFFLGEQEARVLHVPGHTTGHIALWFPDGEAVFCGDTLFSLGCGRMFEGTPEQMWASLERLRALPAVTCVYCGHEYTEANARFALAVEPENIDLQAKAREVRERRATGLPTIPSTIGEERLTNPFFRPQSPEIRRRLHLEEAQDVEIFAELRRLKDEFRG